MENPVEISEEYFKLLRVSKAHRCACGGNLTVAWLEGAYRLRCGRDITHTEFVKRGDLVIERFQARKDAPPEVIALEIEEYRNQEGGRRSMKELTNGGKQTALEQYRGRTELSRADALEILHLIYPKVPEGELVKAALTCATYRLNPLAKHLYIIPFKTDETGELTWAQVWGINATRLIARRAAMRYHLPYGYADFTPRIATEEEQVKMNGWVDATQIWAITILEDSRGLKTYGIGAWPKNKAVQGAKKGNTPENMAKIRSERNALDKLFPGEMVRDVEVVDEAYQEEPLEASVDAWERAKLPSEQTPSELSEEKPSGSPDIVPTLSDKGLFGTEGQGEGKAETSASKAPPTRGDLLATLQGFLDRKGMSKGGKLASFLASKFPEHDWVKTGYGVGALTNEEIAQLLTEFAKEQKLL